MGATTRLVVKVPKELHGKVIGKGAATLKDIESDYGVRLIVPKRDDASDQVVIEGTPEAVSGQGAARKEERECVSGGRAESVT
jgi:hypothetical protein